ncbi:MAG: hypothetical protein ABJH06_02425 [Paraglaciecola sp.]|uniref:hypothetical protein n=1 Tax=Paraglaciecola sp. TaxID=1920173 RepID=UPI003298C131
MTFKSLIRTFLISLCASIAFILIQPLFEMTTLTSKHSAAYVNLGGYNEVAAVLLSWIVHVSVSFVYGGMSTLIYHYNQSMLMTISQVIILGWLTTLIATPANEWVIKFITTRHFTSISLLPPPHSEWDAKLWSHILFFILVVSGLWLAKVTTQLKELALKTNETQV